MIQFTINRNATLPCLDIEPINDGRNDFRKLYLAIQSATVTFSMTDVDSGVKRIANEKCSILPTDDDGCDERFKIRYQWRKRDTKDTGVFKGEFRIVFSDDIVMDGVTFPKGELIVPIAEELIIAVV